MEQELHETLLKALSLTEIWFPWVLSAYIFILILAGSSPIRMTKEAKLAEIVTIKLRQAIYLLIPFLSLLTYAFLAAISYKTYGDFFFIRTLNSIILDSLTSVWALIPIAILAPIVLKFIYHRHWVTAKSNLLRRFRVSQSADQLSDVRVEQGKMKPKNFDPRTYYIDDAIFVGLDENNKPAYIELNNFLKTNIKLIGPTQVGKGVSQGVLLDQAIKKGLGAWFIDLKPDDFIYDIMKQACQDAGRPDPIVVDLNGVGTGNYAPFSAGTKRERYARLYYAFGLDDNDTDADFYKINERKALNAIANHWDGSLMGLQKSLHPKADSMEKLDKLNNSWIYDNSERTRGYLAEWLTMRALNPAKGRGLDIKRSLDAGQVVYIRGSMTDPVVQKATTVLLMEIIQTALAHGPFEKHSYIAVDEIRFLINDMLPKGLATVLSKNLNMSVAYQTIMDLKALDNKNLNADAIKQQIEVNTQITMCHRAQDFETAEWGANLSGTILKSVSRLEGVTVNKMGGEEWDEQRTLNQIEENMLTTNTMLQLPERVSAFFKPNEIAKIIYSCWIPVANPKGIPLRPPESPKVKKPKKQKPSPEESVDEKVKDLLNEIIPEKVETTPKTALDHLPEED